MSGDRNGDTPVTPYIGLTFDIKSVLFVYNPAGGSVTRRAAVPPEQRNPDLERRVAELGQVLTVAPADAGESAGHRAGDDADDSTRETCPAPGRNPARLQQQMNLQVTRPPAMPASARSAPPSPGLGTGRACICRRICRRSRRHHRARRREAVIGPRGAPCAELEALLAEATSAPDSEPARAPIAHAASEGTASYGAREPR